MHIMHPAKKSTRQIVNERLDRRVRELEAARSPEDRERPYQAVLFLQGTLRDMAREGN